MTTEMQRYHEIVRVGDRVEAQRDGGAVSIGRVVKIEDRPFGLNYLVRRNVGTLTRGTWYTRDEITRRA